uniref:Cytoplasmic linker associated protein 1a n=1 Tax=Nothobranchius furzeri TaxID=105023 RepID=A0A8C6NN23_NOTFU
MEPSMENCLAQVLQKDMGRRLQVGQEIIDYILDQEKSHDLEQDQTALDKMVDGIASSWVNSSNFKVALLGLDLLSALVTRLQDRFRAQVGTVLPSLIDRLGDAKDQVREQDQSLLLKIMEQAASPQYVWDRMLGGFKHKNNRTREGVCLCLITTLNTYGAQGLTLSKIVPHICNLLGDPTSQVRDGAISCLVEIYRHVGERVRLDLSKKGIPQSRNQGIVLPALKPRFCFTDKNFEDEDSVDGGRSSSSSSSKVPPGGRRTVMSSARRPSSASSTKSTGEQRIYSNRELEDQLTKIREVLSDDKHDWEHRVVLKKVRSLMLAGAAEYEGFPQQLRLLEAAFKLSAKDLRSQVVRELISNFSPVPVFQHTHYPRLIPIITSNCTSKSVAVRRRCYEFLDLMLQEWQTNTLERHVAVLTETIKKGIHDADSEARSIARKCYWGFHGHYSREAEHLFQALESTYQKALQSYLKSSDSIVSLPQSDRSSSSSQESLNRPLPVKSVISGSITRSKVSTTPGSLQRSRSDIDVNAASSAKSRLSTVPASSPFSSASTLPPGSYASLDGTAGKSDGRVRTRRQSSGSVGGASPSVVDSRGRSRAKVVSQSQRMYSPGSRSSSPGKLLGSGYGRIPRATVSVSNTPTDKRSRIPRSQGCSRETSPNRLGLARSRIPRPSMSQGCSRDTSRESSRDTSPARGFAPLDRYGLIHQARISASVNAMRVLNTGTEVEAAVADALLLGDSRNKRKPLRRRYESPGMYSDDDANSDASSACSERSYSSRNGGIPHYLRQTEDVAEVLNHCASSNWSERKEGLLGLQNLLKSQRILSRVELKRLCEIFTRMFADPHSKVFSMFLETLVDFITVHREDLQDWLFVLLTQLLKKMGADLLGSVQAKVQKALDITRESFPFDQQFNILMRFIVDQTQTPNLKVKVAILKYIESLAQQMDPADFVNSSETRLAVSRIITWTTEPKSSDVRKAAQVVLISLFELNTPEFTMLLGALPKTFQDGATKLLHSHLKNSSNTSSNMGSPSNTIGRTPSRHTPSRTSPLTSPTNCSHGGLSPSRLWGWGIDGLSKHPPAPPPPPPPHSTPAAPSLRVLRRAYSPSMMEYDTENMNSEEIYSSLRGVTEAIQSFSYRSQEDLNEPVRREGKRDDGAGREGVASSPGSDSRVGLEMVEGGRTALDNKTSLLNTPSPRSFSGPRSREFSPYGYGETICTYDKSALKEAVFDDDVEQFRDFGSDLVADLLKELSNHNERSEERKGALVELLKITREDNTAVWDEHFKTILLLLLETLCDKDHTIRALALRVLKEILRNQPARFKNYAELTIMKTLEAHKDSHKEVVRAAEEAASTLAGSIHPEQCIKVLCPIVQTADYPINLAAIKMQTKVIERITKESLLQLLPDIIPGLLQGYDNTESSVRKASVFCLVAIYSVIGEELKPHLAQLTGSKIVPSLIGFKREFMEQSEESSSTVKLLQIKTCSDRFLSV